MKLDFIDLGNLSIAKANMRGKGKDPDVTAEHPRARNSGAAARTAQLRNGAL